MTKLKLKPSPRLWVSENTVRNLKDKLHSPWMQDKAQRILANADWLVRARPIAEGEAPVYMAGTRPIGTHFQCLTAAWVLTHDPKYRRAAIRHLGNMMNWNQISCEAGSNTPADAVLPFCLTYGEHCAHIAEMYDFFRPDITAEEQKVFFDVLDRFFLSAALRCIDDPPWWANTTWSNWNGVCCGGMGMMALAFYDDLPECRKLVPFVENSLGKYFKSYIKNGGGCHEGTGYWNYAMHHAVRYLLSWENATGKKHPAFQVKELGKSLHFPLDFTGISFGDNDGWGPCGFFFMMAKRLNQREAALRATTYLMNTAASAPKRLDRRARRVGGDVRDRGLAVVPAERRHRLARLSGGDVLYAADFIPTPKEMETFQKAHARKPTPVARVYKGLDWAVLNDDSAFPTLRLSARGGSSEITGHGMMDLLSFKCMVNGERMITDQHGGTCVSFTRRGHHIYDRSAASKSTLFVDGLACMENAVCDTTEVVKAKDLLGLRIDGSHIYLVAWKKLFIGRLFLLVGNRYWLVIDRMYDPNTASRHSIESRFHTFAEVRTGKGRASLKSGRERLTMSFAALGGGVMQEGLGMPSLPGEQTRIIRWMSAARGNDLFHVTALNPGSRRLGLKISRENRGGLAIEVSGAGDTSQTIHVSSILKLKK